MRRMALWLYEAKSNSFALLIYTIILTGCEIPAAVVYDAYMCTSEPEQCIHWCESPDGKLWLYARTCPDEWNAWRIRDYQDIRCVNPEDNKIYYMVGESFWKKKEPCGEWTRVHSIWRVPPSRSLACKNPEDNMVYRVNAPTCPDDWTPVHSAGPVLPRGLLACEYPEDNRIYGVDDDKCPEGWKAYEDSVGG